MSYATIGWVKAPTNGDEAVLGDHLPVWVGVVPPDKSEDCGFAPVGSVYIHKPNFTEATMYFKHRSGQWSVAAPLER